MKKMEGNNTRAIKERMLNQHGKVIWMTGLSGAGKSTLAFELEKLLCHKGFLTLVIDSDVVRNGLNRDLGYTEDDRHENLRRVAEMAKIMVDTGIIVIVSFISPTKFSREQARQIIGDDDIIILYVNAPLEVCEKRDVKGLYARARQGLIPMFTGIDSPYEVPDNFNLEIKTNLLSISESIEKISEFLLPYIKLKG
jgi:adenylylsulfate kinase